MYCSKIDQIAFSFCVVIMCQIVITKAQSFKKNGQTNVLIKNSIINTFLFFLSERKFLFDLLLPTVRLY
jgi:hypothetical protein